MFRFPTLSTQQIDYLNMGLMIISLILAYILPFEVFLFSYAVLGPLHYLTEISWLHQKKYYVSVQKEQNKWIFPVVVVLLSIILTIDNIFSLFNIPIELPTALRGTNIILFLFGLAFILIMLRRNLHRIVAISALTVLCLVLNIEKQCITCTDEVSGKTIEYCDLDNKKGSSNFIQRRCKDVDNNGYLEPGTDFEQGYSYYPAVILLSAYIPTLIHVYIFTMLFMLFGALKSRSRSGKAAVVLLIVCGALPFLFDASFIPYSISKFAEERYTVSFLDLNQLVFENFGLGSTDAGNVYTSRAGIMLGRFIAFAYTYHYLNWFSKTSIIQWHKMPVLNLSVVLILWAASVGLYLYDYKTGLTALLLLSFLHVFMEFPLNFQSLRGILEYVNPFGKKAVPA
ncbi:MAG: hypothetical protein IBJ09_11625 [Bacteroidia bacterium]|nr:hypothetical protein [Bacteroidia bacterium]